MIKGLKDVAIGDLFRENDTRMDPPRTVMVLDMDERYVYVENIASERESRILRRSMGVKGTTGWTRVDADGVAILAER